MDIKQVFEDRKGMNENMDLLKTFFHNYDIDKVYQRNAIDYHTMNAEHIEILGQLFLKNI